MSRVYLPTTRGGLGHLLRHGELPVADPVTAEGDDEESEYAALMTAADLSAAIDRPVGEPVRRVVVVGELAEGATRLSRADVLALHLDTEDRGDADDPDDDLAWFAPGELEHLV